MKTCFAAQKLLFENFPQKYAQGGQNLMTVYNQIRIAQFGYNHVAVAGGAGVAVVRNFGDYC